MSEPMAATVVSGTNTSAMRFPTKGSFGQVLRVDTSRVIIDAIDHEQVSQLQVTGLVAIQGAIATEYLVGSIEGVFRDVGPEEITDIDDDYDDLLTPGGVGEVRRDLVRVVLVGTYSTRDGETTGVFRRGNDSFPSVDRKCWTIGGSNLNNLMTAVAAGIEPQKRLDLGTLVADPSVPAVANGDAFFQRHSAIVGSTGSGKSWATATILERVAQLECPNMLLLDVHGEYSELTRRSRDSGKACTGLSIAGPSEGDGDRDQTVFLPYWLLNSEEVQALLVDRTDQNAPNQISRLMHHIRELKKETILREGEDDRFTTDSPIPYRLKDLIQRLTDDNTERVPSGKNGTKQGDFFGKLSRLIARLESKIEDQRLAFMFAAPDETLRWEWLDGLCQRIAGSGSHRSGIKILGLSHVPSDILPIVTSLVARLVFSVQLWTNEEQLRPIALVCDEAHLYMSANPQTAEDRRALSVFERIAKEGRKYGTALVVVSQRPSELSHTVLSQINNFLVLRLTNDTDRASIRSLLPDSMTGLVQSLPLLQVGEAVLVGDSMVLPSRVQMRPPTVKPLSATRNFWQEWNSKDDSAKRITRAVSAMRAQGRRTPPPN